MDVYAPEKKLPKLRWKNIAYHILKMFLFLFCSYIQPSSRNPFSEADQCSCEDPKEASAVVQSSLHVPLPLSYVILLKLSALTSPNSWTLVGSNCVFLPYAEA